MVRGVYRQEQAGCLLGLWDFELRGLIAELQIYE